MHGSRAEMRRVSGVGYDGGKFDLLDSESDSAHSSIDSAPGRYSDDFSPQPQASDLPRNVRREGGQSLVIKGPSLVILEGKACNPL